VFTGDSLTHGCHVSDCAASLGIVVDIADARIKVRRRHWLECLPINQLHRSIAVRYGNVLEQPLLLFAGTYDSSQADSLSKQSETHRTSK